MTVQDESRLRPITSRQNALVKELRKAFHQGEPTPEGSMAIEGLRMIEEAIRNSQNQPLSERLVGALFAWLIASVISIGFASLGGLIGVALFEKRKGQNPPQPPSGYPPPPGQSGASPYGEPPRGY